MLLRGRPRNAGAWQRVRHPLPSQGMWGETLAPRLPTLVECGPAVLPCDGPTCANTVGYLNRAWLHQVAGTRVLGLCVLHLLRPAAKWEAPHQPVQGDGIPWAIQELAAARHGVSGVVDPWPSTLGDRLHAECKRERRWAPTALRCQGHDLFVSDLVCSRWGPKMNP